MKSTRTPGTAKQQTVSIRVSNSLREFLQHSKNVISRNRGESVSISDVASVLLESARDDRLDFPSKWPNCNRTLLTLSGPFAKSGRGSRRCTEQSGFSSPNTSSLPATSREDQEGLFKTGKLVGCDAPMTELWNAALAA